MDSNSLQIRAAITAGLLLGGLVLLHSVSHGERIAPRQPLKEFPPVLGEWRGEDWPLEKRIVEAVGVDDYLNRTYTTSSGQSIELYVGYYSSQQTGDTIHSPKNCLPGAGWEPVRSDRTNISVPGAAPIVVNEYVVEKGLNRLLLLYWYQGRGRVGASEYWGKVWLVADAISRRRTDGALVRLYTTTHDGEEKARGRIVQFVQIIYPRLGDFIPN